MIVVIGCGRAGTRYTAKCVQAAGMDFEHEKLGRDGGIGWLLALFPPDTLRNVTFLHQIRNPLDSIRTLITHRPGVWEKVSRIIPTILADTGYKRAMRYWLEYNIYCSKQSRYSYNVADLYVGSPVVKQLEKYGLRGNWEAAPRDENHREAGEITEEYLRKVDDELVTRILSAWDKFTVSGSNRFHECVPPREHVVTPETRARKIAKAGIQYYGEEEPDEYAVDFLTDLRHYCDYYGVEFAAADRVAHKHYLKERAAKGLQ